MEWQMRQWTCSERSESRSESRFGSRFTSWNWVSDFAHARKSSESGFLAAPPPPTPIETGGTYARSPSPKPPISGKGYTPPPPPPPPSRVLVIIGNYKTPAFIFPRLRPKYTPFPEKMGICMLPSHALEGGGGGGSRQITIQNVFFLRFESLIWKSFAFTQGKIRLSNQERVRLTIRNGFWNVIRSFVNRPFFESIFVFLLWHHEWLRKLYLVHSSPRWNPADKCIFRSYDHKLHHCSKHRTHQDIVEGAIYR